MGFVFALWLHAALFGADAALATPAGDVAAPDDQPLFASATRLDRIGRVMAPVSINGHGPYRLVVDTGASHSTFSPKLVAALGLSVSNESTMELNGVTGVAAVPTVRVDRIQAGDLVLENVRVPVVWSSIMADADGILGVAGLHRHSILVDFRHDRVAITRSSGRIDTTGFRRIPARLVKGGLLMVDARVGSTYVRAIIDTGAERTLGNGALRDALRAHRRGRELQWSNTEVLGATVDVAHGETSIAPPIKIGGVTIKQTEIVYGDFHIFDVWKLDARPALLVGMDVLGTVDALVVDYARRQIYLDVRGNGIAQHRTPHTPSAASGRTARGQPERFAHVSHRTRGPPQLTSAPARVPRA